MAQQTVFSHTVCLKTRHDVRAEQRINLSERQQAAPRRTPCSCLFDYYGDQHASGTSGDLLCSPELTGNFSYIKPKLRVWKSYETGVCR